VTILESVIAWLIDPTHWQGSDGIPARVIEHLQLSGASVVVAAAIALPIGLAIGHSGRGTWLAVNLANVGRAIPSVAVLGLALPLTIQVFHQLEFWPTFVTLVVLAIPPILTNAYVGVRGVEPDLLEAARGMGMNPLQALARIELPLAMPVIVAGLRTAVVQVIATATLGAWVAEGGLGRYIFDGLDRQELDRMIVGGLLVALLALVADAAIGSIQRRLEPSGVRPARRARVQPQVAGATSR